MIFHSHASKTNFLKKGPVLALILNVRVFRTRKWPVRPFPLENGKGGLSFFKAKSLGVRLTGQGFCVSAIRTVFSARFL